MRYNPEDIGFNPGKMTQRSTEISAVFDRHHQELVNEITSQNRGARFVLVPYGSVPAGVATEDTKDLDIFLIFDDTASKRTGYDLDYMKIREVVAKWGLGKEFEVSLHLLFVSNIPEIINNTLTKNDFGNFEVASFLASPMFGNEEDILQMQQVRRSLLARILEDDHEAKRKAIEESFYQREVVYNAEIDGDTDVKDKRRGRLQQALNELGMNGSEWMSQRHFLFP